MSHVIVGLVTLTLQIQLRKLSQSNKFLKIPFFQIWNIVYDLSYNDFC